MKLCPKCQKQFSDDANFCPVDAARLAPIEVEAVAVDALAAKFDLGDRLGGSRTGAVYRATDKATGQAAVVKIIAPAVVALPGIAQRLERELKQLERVQSVGCAKVLASGKRGDDLWVAVELLEGAQTLADGIAARGPLPAAPAAGLIEVIGEALIEAAQVGVVHRDLAPKNILFAGTDVKLINFSLPVPTPDKAPGVPEYVAPEQHDGKPVDQRSNLYSLGALYYFVLTGQPVQHDDSFAVRPPSALAEVPASVDAVILRALDRSPTKRFLTVRQFIDEVVRVAREDAEPAPAAPPARPKLKAELVQTLLGVAPSEPVITLPLATQPAATQPAATQPERSPWAAPSDDAAPSGAITAPTPVVTAPGVAVSPSPAATAPAVAAPVMPTPLAAAPSGKKAAPGAEDNKGKFRETLWFKKGELDAEAALAAAEDRARTGKDHAADKADSLPIDERYKDDGSVSRSDKEKYSLRTSGSIPKAVRTRAPSTMGKTSEDALIGELKSGRNKILALIALGVIVLAVVVFLIVR